MFLKLASVARNQHMLMLIAVMMAFSGCARQVDILLPLVLVSKRLWMLALAYGGLERPS